MHAALLRWSKGTRSYLLTVRVSDEARTATASAQATPSSSVVNYAFLDASLRPTTSPRLLYLRSPPSPQHKLGPEDARHTEDAIAALTAPHPPDLLHLMQLS